MAYLYFSNLNKGTDANDNSLNLITANSGVVFTFDNEKSFYDILGGQAILDEILGEKKSNLLQSLRKNLVETPEVSKILKGQKVYIGFVAGPNNTIDFIIATQANATDLNFEKLVESKGLQLQTNENHYKLNFSDSSAFYIALKEKSIVLSNSSVAIKKLSNGNEQPNKFASYVKENSKFIKNTLANVYLDYNQLPKLLKNVLNTNLTGELAVLDKQNSYAALSYNFASDQLLLNGSTVVEDPNSYYALFQNQPEQPITVDQLLPEQTANYTLFAMNDYQSWAIQLSNWHRIHKKDKEIEREFKVLDDKYRIDIVRTFPTYFQKQFAVFQLNSGEKMGIIKIKNGDKLAQLLLDMSTEYAPDIRIFNENGLLFSFFGEPFRKFERPFYTIIDNHLVVANYASSLQVFLNSYRKNTLLSGTADYTHFKDQISNAATICIYINNDNSTPIFGRNLKAPFYKQVISKNGLKGYNAFAYQLSADNGKFMSNLLLLKIQKPIELDSLVE